MRGFLGLAVYYRRFIRKYAELSHPLNGLLKKNVKFLWTEAAQMAFDNLKKAMSTALVLALPNFNQEFVI